MDSVIYDTLPIFEWTAGIPGSTYRLSVEEEGTWGEIWSAEVGGATSAPYNFDATALSPELLLNHSYFWTVEAWHPDDDHISDPRVGIWTAQHTGGRFAVYGDWPETPPTLPGKIAHSLCLWGYNTGVWPPDWGTGATMGYGTDPTARTWLGPYASTAPDWSPDGSQLLYSKYPGIWIDSLDGTPPIEIPGISGGGPRWAPDGNHICCWNEVWLSL